MNLLWTEEKNSEYLVALGENNVRDAIKETRRETLHEVAKWLKENIRDHDIDHMVHVWLRRDAYYPFINAFLEKEATPQ